MSTTPSTQKRKRRDWRVRYRRHWFDRLLPQAYVLPNNPLFWYETRGLEWERDPDNLRHFTRFIWQAVVAVTLVICLLLLAAMLLPLRFILIYSLIRTLVVVLFGLSLFDRLLIDFNTLAAAQTVGRDLTHGRWQLIALTSMRLNDAVRAKYAAVQLRVWSLVALSMGLRLGVIVLAVFFVFVLPLVYPFGVNPYLVARLGTGPTPMWVSYVPLLLVLSVPAALAYLLEPLWRVRIVAALGLAIAAGRLPPTLALLQGIAVVLLVWAGAMLFAVPPVLLFFSTVAYGVLPNELLVLLAAMLGMTTTLALVPLYRALAAVALGRVQRVMESGGVHGD
jgi:hypothetical protein